MGQEVADGCDAGDAVDEDDRGEDVVHVGEVDLGEDIAHLVCDGGGIAGPYTSQLYVRGVQTAGGDGLFEIGTNVATGEEPMWHVPDGAGGGLLSEGGMYLERVTVRGNQANHRAGGIASSHQKLTMKDSEVAGNYAASFAGGVSASYADLLLERVTIGATAGDAQAHVRKRSDDMW